MISAHERLLPEVTTCPLGPRWPTPACCHLGRWQARPFRLRLARHTASTRPELGSRIVRTEVTLSRGQNAEARSSGSDASAREGLALSVMSNNDIEGDPLQFLRVSEAYWQVRSAVQVVPATNAITRASAACLTWLEILIEHASICAGHEVGSCQEGPCSHTRAA